EFAIPGLSPIRLLQIERIEGREFARGLGICSNAQSFGPGEVGLRRQSSPIGRMDGNEARVVVAVAYAGILKGSVGVGAGGSVGAVGNWSALHAAREVEGTNVTVHRGAPRGRAADPGIQIAPQAPDLGVSEIAAFIRHHCGSAIPRFAVAGTLE